MTISSTQNRTSYSGNGVTTVFSFPYRFLADADLKVLLVDTTTGVETLQTLTTNYTVTGAGESSGGSVTMLVAPPTGNKLVIYRDPALTQLLDLVDNDPFSAEEIEKSFDKLTAIAQRQKEIGERSVRLADGFTDTFDLQLPAVLQPGRTFIINEDGDGFEEGPLADDIENAQTYAGNAATSASESAASATNSANSATASAASAAAAENTRAAVELALNSVGWQDTIPTTGDLVLDETYNGCLILADCSLGNIQITLPPISNLDLDFPFSIGIKKSDSSGNSVTVVRANTDTIDGNTSKIISTASAGAVFIPDSDPSPNLWTTAEFGATAGNMTVDRFSGTGAQTAFTLSVDPGSKNNTKVYIEGVYQFKNTYSVSGTTLTFNVAPFSGTDNIEVISGTTLPSGVPSDATVTISKLAADVLAFLVPTGVVLEYAGTVAPTGFLMCNGQSVSRTTYANLFAAIGTAHGSVDGNSFNVPDRRGNFARGHMDISTVSGSGSASSNNATFTAHGINRTGFKVRLSSGTLTGLSGSTTYYAIVVDANTLAFASSHANAIAGTKIAISGVNSAVITQWEDPDRASRQQAAVGGNTATGVGARLESANLSHGHSQTIYWETNSGGNGSIGGNASFVNGNTISNINASGGNEARPNEIVQNFIIKT